MLDGTAGTMVIVCGVPFVFFLLAAAFIAVVTYGNHLLLKRQDRLDPEGAPARAKQRKAESRAALNRMNRTAKSKATQRASRSNTGRGRADKPTWDMPSSGSSSSGHSRSDRDYHGDYGHDYDIDFD